MFTGNENLNAIESIIEVFKYATHRLDEIHDVLIVIMNNQDKFFKYQKDFRSDVVAEKQTLESGNWSGANFHVHLNLRFYVTLMNRAHTLSLVTSLLTVFFIH